MEGARPKSGGLRFKDVINITASPPAERKRDDLLLVTDWMRKISSLFADMDRDIVYNVMKNCKCQFKAKDTMVVKQGDKGNAFYIILHGNVSIFVKEEKPSLLQELLASDKESDDDAQESTSPTVQSENEEPETPVTKSTKQKFCKVLPMIRVARLVAAAPKAAPKSKPDPRKGLGAKVAQLRDGAAFGELALQRSDNKRAASVVTDTDVVFLVIERELYNKSIKAFQAKELAKFRDFVEMQPLFNHWPVRLQAQVIHSISKAKGEAGKMIVQQGHQCDGLHFVIEGDTRVIVNSQLHSRLEGEGLTDSQQHNTKQPTDSLRAATPIKLGVHETLRSLSTSHIGIKRREGYAAAEEYQKTKHRSLCITGPCQVIGDLEQCLGLSSYIQTVQAETATVLYHISRDNLSRLMKLASIHGQASLDATQAAMKESVYEKWTNRIDHLNMASELVIICEFLQSLREPEKRLDVQKSNLTMSDKFLQSLFEAYIKGQCPLVNPAVEGSPYYKTLMQTRAEQRKLRRVLAGSGETATRLKPIRNNRKARSIAMLKTEIRRRKTSDVNVIVPHRQFDQNAPQGQADADEEKPVLEKPTAEIPTDHRKNIPQFNFVLERQYSFLTDALYNSTKPETQQAGAAEGEVPSMAAGRDDPVLVTERVSACGRRQNRQVRGKALQLVSHYLQGRIPKETDEERFVKVVVNEVNQEAEHLERKMKDFLKRTPLLQPTSSPSHGVRQLRRLDESTMLMTAQRGCAGQSAVSN